MQTSKLKCPICKTKLIDDGSKLICVDCGTYDKMHLPQTMAIQNDGLLFELLCRIPFIVYAFIIVGESYDYFRH